MTRRPLPTLSTAESVAIGICVTARLFEAVGVGALFDGQSRKYHPNRCRWCSEPTEKLLERLGDFGIRLGAHGTMLTDDARQAEAEWKELSGNVRWARLREAQEPAWFEEAPL